MYMHFHIHLRPLLTKVRTIKKVDVAYITEQLATGDFIKRDTDYVLFHKSNKGEVINFLGYFPSQQCYTKS